MKLSVTGAEALEVHEGNIPHGYNDSAHNCTRGVGHLVHLGECSAAEKRETWTQAQVLAQLRADAKIAEDAIRRLVKVPLAQNEFDALVSLIFNIGVGGFTGSTVLRKLNQGDRKGAADAFLLWAHPPELLGRREDERRMFLSATHDPLHGYTTAERRWIREYDDLARRHADPSRRRVLRRVMAEQRKRIWRAAQPAKSGGDGGGWDRAARRARYASLRARSA